MIRTRSRALSNELIIAYGFYLPFAENKERCILLMKNAKKIIALALALIMLFAFAACTGASNNETTAPSSTESTTEYNGEKIKIAANKGPTGMGMIDLMDNSKYEITVVSDPTQVVPMLSTGEVDIATCPLSLAANLYKKTNGGIKMLGVNTLGVLYIVSNGVEIASLSDLKGQTIYATGQGSTPEYILNHILKANSLENDIKVEYLSEHSELAAKVISGDVKLAVLPEPFVSVVTTKNTSVKSVLSLTDEWKKVNPDTELAMGCVVARKDFIEKNPDAVKQFISDNKQSVENVNLNPASQGDKIAAKGIIDASIFAVDTGLSEKKAEAAKTEKAQAVISRCNIVFIDGSEMQKIADANFKVYFDADPKSVGGEMPVSELYYAE